MQLQVTSDTPLYTCIHCQHCYFDQKAEHGTARCAGAGALVLTIIDARKLGGPCGPEANLFVYASGDRIVKVQSNATQLG